MLPSHTPQQPPLLSQQCKAAMHEVVFPDLATRDLFEKLVLQSEQAALLLATQERY